MKIISLLICMIIIMLCIPSMVFAGDGDSSDLPELDDSQVYRWNLAMPFQRGYLARLYGIPLIYINETFGYDGNNINCVVKVEHEINYYTYHSQISNDIILNRVNNYYIAPPELDSAQRYRWLTASALARVYLARLYGIPKEEAIYYGARYKLASSGFGNNGIPPEYTPYNPKIKNN